MEIGIAVVVCSYRFLNDLINLEWNTARVM